MPRHLTLPGLNRTDSLPWGQAPVHDAVPIMYCLHPEFFTSRAARVEVETHGELTKGCSVADWRGRWGKPVNCEVLVTVDRDRFDQAFVDAIGTLWHRGDLPPAL